ncbi:MAG: type VII toxin-antitoxin system HepT family RNase toxin [Myxococcota bacterium]
MLEYVERLERYRAVDRDRFVADADTHHLAERYLHLAVESALDIANHIIADQGFEAPETYRDAFAILGKHHMIPGDLARRLQAWAGFRNVLVHAYLDIDHGLAWDAVAHDLEDLRRLAAIAAKLL